MFSKKRAEAPQSTPPRPQSKAAMTSNATFSVIGPDVVIKGDISASADLHVDGRVEGDISCASLVQGEASVIEGSIEAESARLAGRVTGSIHVRELVMLRTARADGDVRYDALTIEQGAQVVGRFSYQAPGQTLTDVDGNDADEDASPKLHLAG